jgi:hypothetical protein
MPDGHKLDQRAIKYTNIFHRNALQNLPKLVFLVSKRTVWQPRFEASYLPKCKIVHASQPIMSRLALPRSDPGANATNAAFTTVLRPFV